MNRNKRLAALFATGILAGCGGGGGGGNPAPSGRHIVSIQVTGTPVLVFDHARDQQEPLNIPDAQVTAWKEPGGTVDLLIPSYENYRMRGPDLLHLAIDPHKIYSSTTSGSHIPEAQHDYYHWLLGPYSVDGTHFFSLAHTEWYACLLNGDCAVVAANGQNADTNSWSNTVNSFASPDGGASWQLNTVNGNHAAADVSYHWTGTTALSQRIYLQALNHTGMFGPSRLVQEGAWWYSVASYLHRDFTKVNVAQGLYEAPIDAFGYVLMRTSDPSNPNNWQAWNGGSSFLPMSGGVFLPFLPQAGGAALNAAEPQIVRDTVSNSVILVFTVFGGGNPVYYMTTPSLANPAWSDAFPIGGSAQMTSDAAGPVVGFSDANYPSIIDPQSAGPNFEFTNGSPMLFYNTSPAAYGGDNLARDLYRVQLSVTYSP